MEEVKKDRGLYVSYSKIPVGEEDKYVWIKEEGGNGGHFEIPTIFYRLKTAEEIQQDNLEEETIEESSFLEFLKSFLFRVIIISDSLSMAIKPINFPFSVGAN